mmetsp:Transcript_20133/g.52251  ORF Transcript_20133/g.52251 Transcript_20133/m.52251 type:complete len:224 (+) Transcript_20133:350-1021(+)
MSDSDGFFAGGAGLGLAVSFSSSASCCLKASTSSLAFFARPSRRAFRRSARSRAFSSGSSPSASASASAAAVTTGSGSGAAASPMSPPSCTKADSSAALVASATAASSASFSARMSCDALRAAASACFWASVSDRFFLVPPGAAASPLYTLALPLNLSVSSTLSIVFFCASDAEATVGRPLRSIGVADGSAEVVYTTWSMLPYRSRDWYAASDFARMLLACDR